MSKKFKQYTRTNVAEMRSYTQGETLPKKVSVSAEDEKQGSPKEGDMIARNPENHNDQWLVAKKYFEDNFKELESVSEVDDTPKGRVVAELDSLTSKLNGLNKFLENPSVEGEMLKLLQKQSLVMTNYSNILSKRLELWVD